MAVMFLGTALLRTAMSLSGYLVRAVRCVEDTASGVLENTAGMTLAHDERVA